MSCELSIAKNSSLSNRCVRTTYYIYVYDFFDLIHFAAQVLLINCDDVKCNRTIWALSRRNGTAKKFIWPGIILFCFCFYFIVFFFFNNCEIEAFVSMGVTKPMSYFDNELIRKGQSLIDRVELFIYKNNAFNHFDGGKIYALH